MSDRQVLLLHEGWGRHVGIDGIVDRLTARGFRVAAPDLFAGRSRVATLAGLPLRLRTMSGPMLDDVRSTAAILAGRGPLSVVGLSLGAAIALRLDVEAPVVAAYGHAPREPACRGPILGVYGTADGLLRASGRRLEAAGAEVLWIEGARHSFLLDATRPGRCGRWGRHTAASATWDAIGDFLEGHLAHSA